eukprot:211518-Pleurochrysis_carterae.AAC.1
MGRRRRMGRSEPFPRLACLPTSPAQIVMRAHVDVLVLAVFCEAQVSFSAYWGLEHKLSSVRSCSNGNSDA